MNRTPTGDPVIDDHPFDGSGSFDMCALKWIRAYEHLKTFETEIARNPQKLQVANEFDAEGGYWSIRLETVASIDPYLGTVIGDAIHNARSSLDNLVWKLVELGTDPTPEHPERVQFPMYRSSNAFWVDRKLRMPGVSQADKTILEGFQTYNGGHPRGGHPLDVLNDLWIKDKHRLLLQVAAGRTVGGKIIDAEAIEGQLVRVENLIKPGDPLQVGTEIGRAFATPPDSEVRVRGTTAHNVVVNGYGTLTIAQSINTAWEVLKRFIEKYDGRRA